MRLYAHLLFVLPAAFMFLGKAALPERVAAWVSSEAPQTYLPTPEGVLTLLHRRGARTRAQTSTHARTHDARMHARTRTRAHTHRAAR